MCKHTHLAIEPSTVELVGNPWVWGLFDYFIFRAVLDFQKNAAEATETSHMPLVLEHILH